MVCVFSVYVGSSPYIGSCEFRGLWKKRVSGHMRWGIAFWPRCKSPPSGMCKYFQMHILLSNILNLDPGNLNPSVNIICCFMPVHAGMPWPSPPPLMSGLVSMKPSRFHKPPGSAQPQDFSIDRGSFIIFLWFRYVTCFLFKRGSQRWS